jgi:hypothetical protein
MGVLDRFLVQFEADLLMVGALVPMLEPVPGFIQMLLGNDFLGDIEPAGEDRLELSKRSPITDGLSENLLSRACECDRRQIRLMIEKEPDRPIQLLDRGVDFRQLEFHAYRPVKSISVAGSISSTHSKARLKS